MEMVKTGLITILALCLVSCCPRYQWQSVVMDGSRTGVTALTATKLDEAFGTIDSEVYTSPNGAKFAAGTATYEAAKELIGVQEKMAFVKQVIGSSAAEMRNDLPNGELACWIVDKLFADIQEITGRKVDVAITNLGGIRVDMPKGDVILDDILSMFPFKNYLCYVALSGADLTVLFEQMAKSPQPVSGVNVVYKDSNLESLLVGGEPVDPERIYGVATIDFLLNGGDGLFVAKNAKELITTDICLVDIMLPYAKSYSERGEQIAYSTDDRMIIL